MSNLNPLQEQAQKCERAAEELELAAKHMRTMADHFRNKEIPRAGAHSLAAHGHFENAKQIFAAIAANHAKNAIP